MTTGRNLAHLGLAAVIGAVAAVGTLKLLDFDEEHEPSRGGREYGEDTHLVSSPRDGAGSDVSAAQLRALQRRLEQLERHQGSSTPPLDEAEVPELVEGAPEWVPPPTVTREQAVRELHQEFDRQADLHQAEPVDPEWRRRMEPLVTEQATTGARDLGVAFEGASCRSTTCLLEFTAPNDATRERSQGRLAATNFGDGCARFIVAYPTPDPAAPQTMRMIVDCSES